MCVCVRVCVVTYIFIIEILHVWLDFTNKNLYMVVGGVRVCYKHMLFLVFNKKVHPWEKTHAIEVRVIISYNQWKCELDKKTSASIVNLFSKF